MWAPDRRKIAGGKLDPRQLHCKGRSTGYDGPVGAVRRKGCRGIALRGPRASYEGSDTSQQVDLNQLVAVISAVSDVMGSGLDPAGLRFLPKGVHPRRQGQSIVAERIGDSEGLTGIATEVVVL